jgi:hypothetical protein
VTKDADKLKPPPCLVEGLKQLALPPGLVEGLKRLAQSQQPGRPPVPQQVPQEGVEEEVRKVLDWLVAHTRDGDPQVVHLMRNWLAKQRLDPLMAAELHRKLAALERKRRRSSKREVLQAIIREQFGPAGLPAGMSTYKLRQKIKDEKLWPDAWRRLRGSSRPPELPGLDTIEAARLDLTKRS